MKTTYDTVKIITELANQVIKLRSDALMLKGSSPDLAIVAATWEVGAYLKQAGFSVDQPVLVERERSMRITGGAV